MTLVLMPSRVRGPASEALERDAQPEVWDACEDVVRVDRHGVQLVGDHLGGAVICQGEHCAIVQHVKPFGPEATWQAVDWDRGCDRHECGHSAEPARRILLPVALRGERADCRAPRVTCMHVVGGDGGGVWGAISMLWVGGGLGVQLACSRGTNTRVGCCAPQVIG